MHSVNVLIAFALVSVSLSAVACSSGSSSSTADKGTTTSAASADSADSFCSTYCTKLISCDSSMDSQTCTEDCGTQVKAGLEKLRGDVVTATSACWQSSDCREVLSENRLSDCIKESVVSVAPTDAAKSFCSALVTSYDKCDSSLNYADCLSSMKIFGDDTLAEATSCTEKSCSTIVGCVNATLAF